MARRCPRPRPTRVPTLTPVTTRCPECQHTRWADSTNFRTVTTRDAGTRRALPVRRPNPACPRYHQPYRPEAEPPFALPHQEFGLDVLALVGRFRHAEPRVVPEFHRELTRRGFDSQRDHARRASGRQRGSPGLVVAGCVRVVSSLATRLRPEEGLRLSAGDVEGWRQSRAGLEQRRESRRQQRRFRRDPVSYLQKLEELALQLSLPA